MILFTSDNGATFEVGGSDPYYFHSNGRFKAGKGSLYEGGIRVPMIAYWPGTIQGGRVSGVVSASWDFMSTFADLTGSSLAPGQDGISLMPELLGIKGQKKHDFLYWEYPGRSGALAVRIGDWKGIWKNIIKEPYRRLELYNLKTDSAEQFNVAKDHPNMVKQMMECMSKRTPSEKQDWNFIGKKTLEHMSPGKPAN
jgi:arylsulfatase